MAKLKSVKVAGGLARPVFATAAPGDGARLFVVEQHTGLIRILDLSSGAAKPAPFLQVTGLSTSNEQGLLGLAFHPQYATDGLFFVYFTDAAGATNVRRYRVSADPDVADPTTATTVLKFPRPFNNHCGGWIGFGPGDGMLYVASGDGGSEQDPRRNGQNLGTLLAKMLRIDVNRNDFPGDPNRAYGIPPDNPFRQRPGALPEVWAYGLRNPWRCSFDRQSGDLWIGDVGQDDFEEIDFQPASSKGGENYGWRLREGRHATSFAAGDTPGPDPFVDPVIEYSHDTGGTSVIGGYRYRGSQIPGLSGHYFFSDFTGSVSSVEFDGLQATEPVDRTPELFPAGPPGSVASFAEDSVGELYLLILSPGSVYRIGAAAPG